MAKKKKGGLAGLVGEVFNPFYQTSRDVAEGGGMIFDGVKGMNMDMIKEGLTRTRLPALTNLSNPTGIGSFLGKSVANMLGSKEDPFGLNIGKAASAGYTPKFYNQEEFDKSNETSQWAWDQGRHGLGGTAFLMPGSAGIKGLALAGGMTGLSQAEDPKDALGKTIGGTITGGALGVGGKVVGKVFNKLAKSKLGDMIRGNTFKLEVGKLVPTAKARDFLQNHILKKTTGTPLERITQMEAQNAGLAGTINNALANSNATASGNKIISNWLGKLKPSLGNKGGFKDVLTDFAPRLDELANKYGENIPLTEIHGLKMEIQNSLKKMYQQGGVTKNSADITLRTLRDELDKAVTKGAPEVKSALTEMSTNHTAMQAMQKQANKPGRITVPFVGGVGVPTGGVPTKAIDAVGRGVNALGNAANKLPTMSPAIATALQKTVVPATQMMTGAPAVADNDITIESLANARADAPNGGAMPSGGGSPETAGLREYLDNLASPRSPQVNMRDFMLKALASGKYKPDEIISFAEMVQSFQPEPELDYNDPEALLRAGMDPTKVKAVQDIMGGGGAGMNMKPLTGEEMKNAVNARSGMKDLENLQQLIQDEGTGALWAAKLPGPLAGGSGQKIKTIRNNITDTLARLRSGAAITEDEEKRFATFIPGPTDSEETAAYKLEQLRNALAPMADPYGMRQQLMQEFQQGSNLYGMQ